MVELHFGTRTASKTSRSTFQPALETLEARVAPANIQALVSAAFHELPNAVSNLQQNIQAGNVQNGMANFKIITNDVKTLSNGASSFEQSSRSQIDITLYMAGIQLFQEGFQLAQMGDAADANILTNEGANAAIGGLFDFLFMQDGVSTGKLTLQ
jgi:hypothetical protein